MRQTANPKLPLNIEENAFFGSENNSFNYDILQFVGFKRMITVPTLPLSKINLISSLTFVNSSFATIDDNSFKGVLAIDLQLNGCGIQTISDNAFANMKDIPSIYPHSIYLDYNLLTVVPIAVTLVKLTSLSLQHNRILKIPDYAFWPSSSKTNCSLNFLYLNYNPIGNNISDNAFANTAITPMEMNNIGIFQ